MVFWSFWTTDVYFRSWFPKFHAIFWLFLKILIFQKKSKNSHEISEINFWNRHLWFRKTKKPSGPTVELAVNNPPLRTIPRFIFYPFWDHFHDLPPFAHFPRFTFQIWKFSTIYKNAFHDLEIYFSTIYKKIFHDLQESFPRFTRWFSTI